MELSEYEAKRQRRIELNQKKLQALDVHRLIQRTHLIKSTKKVCQNLHPVRRSLRQRQQREDAVKVPDMKNEAIIEVNELPPHCKRIETETIQSLDLPVAEQLASNQVKKVHLTSSQIDIEVEAFHQRCLGTQLLPVGKQTVMQTLCPPEFVAKFSKMSGVQPWKNAIVLFVNVESDSFYDNVFHQETIDGRSVVHFQWFGQNRWHEESPLVTRLRGTKRGDERLRFDNTYDDKEEKHVDPLLLFLRQTQGPYVYCGQLGYLGHRPASKPLEFRWQLLDAHLLQWKEMMTALSNG